MTPPIDFQQVFDLAPAPFMLLDRQFRFVAANRAYAEVTATRVEDLIGRGLFELFPHDPLNPDNANARMLRESLQRVLDRKARDVLALIPYRVPKWTPSGVQIVERFWSATHTPFLDAQGEVAFILQHTEDVTELHEARAAQQELGVLARAKEVQRDNDQLAAEHGHLRQLFEQAPGFIAVLRGPEHRFELTNAAYRELVGNRPLLGLPVADALPEARSQGFITLLDHVYRSAEPYVGRNVPVTIDRDHAKGPEVRLVDFVYQPVFERDGRVSGIFVQGHDVTEQHRARDEVRVYREHLEELVLQRTAELEQREAELRQAQKMEAVGSLTGGVAHDFNNLLQVIGGNLQLLQVEPDPQKARARLGAAMTAVDRGARLASQLLAFARRQPLAPKVVDPARLVRSMEELIRRALGDAIGLSLAAPAEPWNVRVDPHVLETVLLNLVINARDAIDGAGQVTVSVENLPGRPGRPGLDSGDYVTLAVTDTGRGMPPEIRERAFEPFFTTKPEGRGTGLGLSMVYGFVRQSGGQVALESEPGRGTTLRLHLPRCFEEAAQEAPAGEEPIVGGNERVLVVEDDPEVRATVVGMLADLGYRILEARDAAEALALLQDGAVVDLLFTDVVMPGPLRSPELARSAKALLPDLAVLFTSGYTQDVIAPGGRLEAGTDLLPKPYRREELARKLRQVLRARAPARPLRILLVEDDPFLRESTEDLLCHLGHQPTAVGSAEDAHGELERGEFDVLFADVRLPGQSGIALAEDAIGRRPHLKVILASGDGAEVRPGNGALRAARVLPKPYDLAELERTLERLRAG